METPDEMKEFMERHLRETKAKSKSKSFEDLSRRIRTEQEFRKVLDDLKENIHSQEILPFLGPGRDESEYPPDFLVWIDEFRIPIFLVKTSDEEGHLVSRERIESFLKYIRRTDLTEVVLVWMSPPSFPSKHLRIEAIETMMRGNLKDYNFEDTAPFKEAVLELVNQKISKWIVPKHVPEMVESEISIERLKSIFFEAFQTESQRRSPRLPYKKVALRDIGEREIEDVFSLMAKYIRGDLSLERFTDSFRTLARKQR